MSRRALLRASLRGGAITIATTSCTAGALQGFGQPGGEPMPDTTWPTTTPGRSRSILLAYFSRPGENYYYGDRIHLEVGNTEVLAGLIRDRIDCDVYRIEAADAYPENYDATVERNVREQDGEPAPPSLTRRRHWTGTTSRCSPARSGTSGHR
jgi:hypothetical protein